MKTTTKMAIGALALFSLMLIAPMAMADNNTVNVRFWLDQNMNDAYLNNMMKVWFQNKTVESPWTYNYSCYHANYVNGTASIFLNVSGTYDLLITDGNLQWSNVTGCPTMIENQEFLSTVQSEMQISSDQTLDYWINVTITGEPRDYFWNTQSIRTLMASLYWVLVLVIILVAEWYLTKNGGTPSWVLPIIIFIVAVIVKLAVGF